MGEPEVAAFLTHLAVERNVAASTQNQAFGRRGCLRTAAEQNLTVNPSRLSNLVFRRLRTTIGLAGKRGRKMDKAYSIKNCEEFLKCPQHWGALEVTEKPDQRFCNSCERRVYFCEDDDSLNMHIEVGHCVAIRAVDQTEGTYYVGNKSGSAYGTKLGYNHSPASS